MKYYNLEKFLKNIVVFSNNDLKLLDDKYNSAKVNSWLDSWYIKKIRNWFYVLSNANFSEDLLYLIANKIYSPSYIWLETALWYYNLIPEIVFFITNIWTKKTSNFSFEWTNFSYKKIKSELFFWYDVVYFWKLKFLISDLEKTILDFFYFHSEIKDFDDFEEMLFNKQILQEKLNFEKIIKYSKIFDQKRL